MDIGFLEHIDFFQLILLVMKVPMEPNAGVYYTSEEDIMYTFRYYAAWQAYADMVNNDWITNAEADRTVDFENFSLSALFAEASPQDNTKEHAEDETVTATATNFEIYDPYTVIATVNGSEFTWREYSY